MADFLRPLREANVIRDREWDSNKVLDASFFGNELAGEVGEAIEVVSHLMNGGVAASYDALADELADVIICVDLLALQFNLFVNTSLDWDGSAIDATDEIIELAIYTGRACNLTKKLERERLGLVGSRTTREALAVELAQITACVFLLAIYFEIRLDVAVALKFNATSDKCGLATKMVVPA